MPSVKFNPSEPTPKMPKLSKKKSSKALLKKEAAAKKKEHEEQMKELTEYFGEKVKIGK